MKKKDRPRTFQLPLPEVQKTGALVTDKKLPFPSLNHPDPDDPYFFERLQPP